MLVIQAVLEAEIRRIKDSLNKKVLKTHVYRKKLGIMAHTMLSQ
jgi:hypothetical protein